MISSSSRLKQSKLIGVVYLGALLAAAGCGPGTDPPAQSGVQQSDASALDVSENPADTGEPDGSRLDVRGDTDTQDADAADVITCIDRSEACNGEDDNCNGITDEGCGCTYEDGTGVCSNATIGAQDGTCQPPETYEQDETTCDDKDNDCDGTADEGCPCNYEGHSQGVCATGVKSPEDGTCQKPDGYISGSEDGFRNAEHCDGKDNDCDGAVDEGCTCDYSDLEVGVCGEATRDYVEGTCQQPLGFESDETSCDGQDNDCDGETDEGCTCVVDSTEDCYTGPSGTATNGICERGTKTCIRDGDNSKWGPCTGETLPAAEVCGDSTDNDCDGKTDESSAVHEDFEGTDTGWSKTAQNTVSGMPLGTVNIDTNATPAHNGSESAKAAGPNQGVCGYGGLSKSFNFSQSPTQITIWVRSTDSATGNYSRINVMLKDSSGVHNLWTKKSGGSGGVGTNGWKQLTFSNLSQYDSNFTLIIGNHDTSSQWCDMGDHDWAIWVDDIEIEQPSCSGS